MSSAESEMKNSTVELLPHQIALLDTFFSPESKRVLLLRGDVGLGKSIALTSLAARLLRERPNARVLFLVPSSLRMQFMDTLSKAGVETYLVDRYRYREMLDSAAVGEFWPRGVVLVLSVDFAKKPDIKESLVETYWDLVIADEAHSFRGARAELLKGVGTSAGRVVLVTAIPFDLKLPDAFAMEDTTIVEWRRDRVVGNDGRLLDVAPRPVLHETPFVLNQAELGLRATINGLCEILGGPKGKERFRVMTLLRSLESSPAALEVVLRRLAISCEVEEDLEVFQDSPDEEEVEGSEVGRLGSETAEKAAGIVARALQDIDAIGVDSKLSALGTLLISLNQEKILPCRICLVTDYVATIFYLAAEIESRDMAFQLLHGGMVLEDRLHSLELFSHEGGILIGTRAVMTEGIDLRHVTDLVLYDVPGSKVAVQQVLGRFDRIGRRTRLSIHVFTPSNISDGISLEALGLLRGVLSNDTGSF